MRVLPTTKHATEYFLFSISKKNDGKLNSTLQKINNVGLAIWHEDKLQFFEYVKTLSRGPPLFACMQKVENAYAQVLREKIKGAKWQKSALVEGWEWQK